MNKPKEDEVRARLSPIQYDVTQHGGTERAFTGEYVDNHDAGTYHCVVCGAELFASDDKYDSGSGWPSYTCPVGEGAVDERDDSSHGMTRTEVVCHQCGAHLGHLFPDGPPDKGGQRYCINSAALRFQEAAGPGAADHA